VPEPAPISNRRTRKIVVAGVLASIACFYVGTIRQGTHWGDDFALYIHHAQNIASGQSYAKTGYIYNPAVPEYGPRIYPPVFPLLLAPVYRVLGLNLWAMKLEQVIFFLLVLVVLYRYWRDSLDFTWLLACIALLGLNPSFWSAKDDILSDVPFLLFFYLAALLVRSAPDVSSVKWGALVGVVLYLCTGTRSVGIVLVPALILFDLLRHRRITRLTATSVLICGALLVLQRAIAGSAEGSYFEQLHPTLAGVGSNFLSYARSLATFWLGTSRGVLAFALLIIAGALALVGTYVHIKRGLTILEAFLAPYLTVVLIWPARQGLRLLFPLIPLFVYLTLLGLRQLSLAIRARYASVILPAFLLLAGLSYAATYRTATYGTIRQVNGLPSFHELCARVRDGSNPDDVFIFRYARALSLFTSRPAATYQSSDADLWRFMRQVHATYVISSPTIERDRQFLIPFVQRYSPDFELRYKNADFELYGIRSYPELPSDRPSPSPETRR
jgi:hypothetical protein